MTAGAPQFHRVCPTPSGSHSALPEQSGGPWVHRSELTQVLLHAQPLRVAPSSEGLEGGAQQVSFRAAVKMAVPGRSPPGSHLAAPLRAPRVHVRPRPHRHSQSSGPFADQAAAASSLPRRSQSVLQHLPPAKVRVAFWPQSGRVCRLCLLARPKNKYRAKGGGDT